MKNEQQIVLSNKRQIFRIQIRKAQNREVFQNKRKKLQSLFQNLKQNEQQGQIKQVDYKNLIKKLLNQPLNSNWKVYLSQLLNAFNSFKQKIYQIPFQIIQKIKQLLKNQYLNLDIKQQICMIFTKILQKQNFNSIISLFQSQQFIDNLIQAYQSEFELNNTFKNICNFLFFTSNLIYHNYKIKIILLTKNYIQLIIRIYCKFKSFHQVQLISIVVYSLLSQQKLQHPVIKYNQASAFLPMLSHFIMFSDQNILQRTLVSLENLTCGLQYKISNIFYAQNIKDRLLELINFNNQQIRILSLRLCNSIVTCQNKVFTTQLAQRGILDELQKLLLNKQCSKMCKKLILSILYNFSLNSQFERQQLIYHNILNCIGKICLQVGSMIINKLGIRVFQCLYNYASINEMNQIIKKIDILDLLMNNINKYKQQEAQIVAICLNIIYSMLISYESVYIYDQNMILKILYQKYEFNVLVQNLFNHKNKKINQASGKILQFLTG